MSPEEVKMFFNELNRTIYVTGDTWNFKNVLEFLKGKYPNLKDIFNYQIKPMDKLHQNHSIELSAKEKASFSQHKKERTGTSSCQEIG